MTVDTQVRDVAVEVESKTAALEAIVQNVRIDSRQSPEQYLGETVSPFGGE